MTNVFSHAMATGRKIHEVYDLKGSSVNRRVLKPGEKGHGQTLKDLDLTRKIIIGFQAAAALKSQIISDVSWLHEHNIMDYSLLVRSLLLCTCLFGPMLGSCLSHASAGHTQLR